MDCVIIDNGSTSIKGGFSGEDNPVSIVPTVTGVETTQSLMTSDGLVGGTKRGSMSPTTQETSKNNMYVGKRLAAADRKDLELTYPIQRGHIENWESVQACWDHIYDQELRIEPEAFPVLMTDTPLNPKRNREKMASIMFESYNVPGFYVANKSVLSLFATGRTRGVVLGLGAGITSVVPVFEGYALPHATKRLDFAGEDLTDFLSAKLNLQLKRDIVQDIKETTCSVSKRKFKSKRAPSGRRASAGAQNKGGRRESGVSEERRLEEQACAPVSYELPDGQIVDINYECQKAIPEALFDPSIANPSNKKIGVSHLTFQSVLGCDKTLQNDLFGSIVLAGGSSMFPGFATRIENDIIELSGSASKVQVVPDSQRKYAAWIGGSMFASLETFQQIQISRAEWEENGARIVHQKCL